MNHVDVLLKEYETIRQEILASMNNRISILSFGLAAIGAIFTASIATQTGNTPSIFSGIILALVIPLISIFVLFMWLGEYQRMQRAGKFLVELEQRINSESAKELLSWETQLRSQRRHMKYPYSSTVLMIIIISLTSQIIGLITLSIDSPFLQILVVAGVVLHLAIYLNTVSNMFKLRL